MSNPFDMLNAMGGMGGIGNMISSFQETMKTTQAELAKQHYTAEVVGWESQGYRPYTIKLCP